MENVLTFRLTSDFRWGGEHVVEIQEAIRNKVNSRVVINHEINNWDRFTLLEADGLEFTIYDTVNNVSFKDGIKDRVDALKLTSMLNATFSDTTSWRP